LFVDYFPAGGFAEQESKRSANSVFSFIAGAE